MLCSFCSESSPALPVRWRVVAITYFHSLYNLKKRLGRAIVRAARLSFFEKLMGLRPVALNVGLICILPIDLEASVDILAQIRKVRVVAEDVDSCHGTSLQTFPEDEAFTIQESLLVFELKLLESISDLGKVISLYIDSEKLDRLGRALDRDCIDFSHKLLDVFCHDGH